MRYPEGRRALNSSAGKDLLESLTPTELNDFFSVEVGHQFVLLTSKRINQGVYEVTHINEEEGNQYIHVNKLTNSGKLSKARGSQRNLRKRQFENNSWHYSTIYKFYWTTEAMIKEFNIYFERTKDKYVSSGEDRDSQRQRVYDAENKLRRKMGKGKEFKSLDRAQGWLTELISSPKFKELFPDFGYGNLMIDVCNRHKNKCVANYWRRKIIVAGNSWDFGMNELVLSHELAHFTAEDAQHNAPFTTNLINILAIINSDLSEGLKQQYDKHNVNY